MLSQVIGLQHRLLGNTSNEVLSASKAQNLANELKAK